MKSLFALLLVVSSLSPAAHAADSTVAFYFGKVTYLEEGKAPAYAVSLVKREVIPAENKIMETVVEKDDEKAEEYPTLLVRVGTTNSFELLIKDFPMKGVMNFSGPEWNWDAWTYDFVLTLPHVTQLIRGTGAITAANHVETSKVIEFLAPGKNPVRIKRTEDLEPVTEVFYGTKRAELLGK